uniref:Uncharacterized protein n=1 Tax=Romanomermis culicivorax TaxID=13658 RepID=A0A915K6R3_ROMCU
MHRIASPDRKADNLIKGQSDLKLHCNLVEKNGCTARNFMMMTFTSQRQKKYKNPESITVKH